MSVVGHTQVFLFFFSGFICNFFFPVTFHIIEYPVLLESPISVSLMTQPVFVPFSVCLLSVSFRNPFKHIQRCSLTFFMSLRELTCHLLWWPTMWHPNLYFCLEILCCAPLANSRLVTGRFQIDDMMTTGQNVYKMEFLISLLKPASSSWLPIFVSYVTKN